MRGPFEGQAQAIRAARLVHNLTARRHRKQCVNLRKIRSVLRFAARRAAVRAG